VGSGFGPPASDTSSVIPPGVVLRCQRTVQSKFSTAPQWLELRHRFQRAVQLPRQFLQGQAPLPPELAMQARKARTYTGEFVASLGGSSGKHSGFPPDAPPMPGDEL
jgi:hypothetical protein